MTGKPSKITCQLSAGTGCKLWPGIRCKLSPEGGVNFEPEYADHKGICAKRTFSRLGTFIYRQLKRWAKYQHGNKNRWWIYYRYFQNNHFTDQRITKKGIEHNRLYRIAYVPIRYHVKVKSKANPFLPEFDKYFFKRTKWREDLAKECKQVTTFVMQETINHGRVSLRRDSLKRA